MRQLHLLPRIQCRLNDYASHNGFAPVFTDELIFHRSSPVVAAPAFGRPRQRPHTGLINQRILGNSMIHELRLEYRGGNVEKHRRVITVGNIVIVIDKNGSLMSLPR